MPITTPDGAWLLKKTLCLIRGLWQLVSVSCDQLILFRLESTFQYILTMYNNGTLFAEIKMAQGHVQVWEEGVTGSPARKEYQFSIQDAKMYVVPLTECIQVLLTNVISLWLYACV